MIVAFLLGIPFTAWIIILAALFIIDVACFAFESYSWSLSIMILSIGVAVWLDSHASHWVTQNLQHILLWYIPLYIVLGFGTALVKWFLYTLKRVGWIRDAKLQFDLVKEEEPNFVDLAKKQINAERDPRVRFNDHFSTVKLVSDLSGKEYEDEVSARSIKLEREWRAALPASRRKNFVEFYRQTINLDSARHKIYPADFTKEHSVVDALAPRAKDHIGKITIWIFQWPVVIVASLIEDFLIKLAKHFATMLDYLFSQIVRGAVAKATKGL